MRLRKNNNANEILANSEFYVKNFPVKLKGNEVLEIGAGKGKMITEMALKNPDKVFYALEKYESVAARIIQKINNLEIKNLFVIVEDASKIQDLFDGEFETIWLTFSDPWPKAKHEKRRLTYKYFLNLYTHILSDDGILKLKTDNAKFFNYSAVSLALSEWTILAKTDDISNSRWCETNIQTEYELKWARLGESIKFLMARKP